MAAFPERKRGNAFALRHVDSDRPSPEPVPGATEELVENRTFCRKLGNPGLIVVKWMFKVLRHL
jgi:hypothetical protein